MNATGLKTVQSAFGGSIIRALLAAVVLAVMVTVLIVGATGTVRLGSPVAAPAPNAADDALIQFRADERATLTPAEEKALLDDALIKVRAGEREMLTPAAGAAAVGHPRWIAPDRGDFPHTVRGANSGSYHAVKQIPNR